LPLNIGDLWWDIDWQYRKEITIDYTKVDGDLNNFPILINITDNDLKDDAQNYGDDIAFTDKNGNQLSHEIELFNGSSGDLVCWVNVTQLSSSVDTVLYMYYGNSVCVNQENVSGVWDSGYVMVQHLDESPLNDVVGHFDSTFYNNDGIAVNFGGVSGSTTDAVGLIDGADEFDGSDDFVKIETGVGGWRDQSCGFQRAVIKDGMIFVVGGGDAGVSSFDAYIFVFDLTTGEILQKSPSLGVYTFTASETAPVVDGDVVYVCPTKSNVFAWNMSSDAFVWNTSDLSIWCNRMEFDGSFLYVTTTDYDVKKIDVSDGSVVASFSLDADSDFENAVPVYLDEVDGVVFAVGESRLYKLSASDLSEVWNVSAGGGNLDAGSGHSRMAPIVVNDSFTGDEPWVIFGSYGSDVFYAFDYAGNEEWNKSIPEGVRSMSAYNPNHGFLYIPSQGDKIYVLDVTDGSEEFVISSVPSGSSYGRPCTVTDNDYLIFKTTSGSPLYIYIYNASNGQYIGSITAGYNIGFQCFPIGVSDGYLVTGGSLINYGGSDGGIFVYKVGIGQPVDYYPLYGPYKFGFIEGGLTDLLIPDNESLNPTDSITLESWGKLDEITTGSNDHLICKASAYCLKFAQSPSDVPRFQLFDSGDSWHNLDLSDVLDVGEWYYLAGTWDGSIMRFYINGMQEGTLGFTGTIKTTDTSPFIGNYDGSSDHTPDGVIDEVRISNVARGVAWINTFYNTMNHPSTFLSVGNEEIISDDHILPTVEITKPAPGIIYIDLFGIQIEINRIIPLAALIFGKINVSVNASDNVGIESVKFYVDDVLKATVTEPSYSWVYIWFWGEQAPLFQYDLKVVARDYSGNQATDMIKVWRIQLFP